MFLQEIREDQVSNPQIYDVLYLINTNIYWKDLNGKYLGGNKYFLETFGLDNQSQLIGKTDYDLFAQEDADLLKGNDLVVIHQGKFTGEESVKINSKTEYFYTTKNKLIGQNGNIIGIFGVSTCITDTKNKMTLEKNRAILEEEIKTAQIVDLVPAYIYWKHKNERYIACNKYQKDRWGFDLAGKTEYDIWSKEEADRIHAIDQYVFENGSHSGEEVGKDPADGTIKYFLSSKQQLRDSKGNITGIVGISIDISAQKEAEKLKIENEKHKAVEEQQERFRRIVDQVVHDIRSPIASMQMILPSCKKLPEAQRVSLNKAASRVMDIANRLLNEVTPAEHEEPNENQTKVNLPTLISSEIFEVISEKKYEYKQKTIDFCAHIAQNSYFIFLNVISSDFKRMLSNLINNSVEAIKGKIGKIDLYLDIVDYKVQITLQDNGSGMPDAVREKILNNISVTDGKTDGHGIGFSQIRDTLENSQGILDIESSIGVGTKIILTFTQAETPDWIAKQIELFNDDIIVILDDDESIHGAWETRFKDAAPNIIRKHFEQGEEAITFINSLDKVQKENVFLLTDYELLDQGLHGLHVVQQTGISRSILVTSHHNSKEVRDLAKLHNTKILPKPLAPQIPINIVEQQVKEVKGDAIKHADNALSIVDIVLVDDDIDFSNNFKRFITSNNKTIDKYNTVSEFMNNISKYPKNACLFIDNQFKNENITGIKVAEELHNMGYSNLYLFSGIDYSKDLSIPDYLTPVLKTNINYVFNLLNK